MSAKEIAAIKVQNEKGENTVARVKVKRYFPGKAPSHERDQEEDEKTSDQTEQRDFASRYKGKLKEIPSAPANPALEGYENQVFSLSEENSRFLDDFFLILIYYFISFFIFYFLLIFLVSIRDCSG